ncbi:unnamed protein product [Orchesella dallaii]|uniref:Gustatory receptor n=1 Tax=Orchesella dallaii TaxID=48710 RepID=A0ABP1QAU5_9HEXA
MDTYITILAIDLLTYYTQIPGLSISNMESNRIVTEKTHMLLYLIMSASTWCLAAEIHRNTNSAIKHWIHRHQFGGELNTNDRFKLLTLADECSTDPVAVSSRFFHVTYGFLMSLLTGVFHACHVVLSMSFIIIGIFIPDDDVKKKPRYLLQIGGELGGFGINLLLVLIPWSVKAPTVKLINELRSVKLTSNSQIVIPLLTLLFCIVPIIPSIFQCFHLIHLLFCVNIENEGNFLIDVEKATETVIQIILPNIECKSSQETFTESLISTGLRCLFILYFFLFWVLQSMYETYGLLMITCLFILASDFVERLDSSDARPKSYALIEHFKKVMKTANTELKLELLIFISFLDSIVAYSQISEKLLLSKESQMPVLARIVYMLLTCCIWYLAAELNRKVIFAYLIWSYELLEGI